MAKAVLWAGIDDTDSPRGMCTTYLGFRIAAKLVGQGDEFCSYPRLVRFNPNIPWKTRGNGAVGLHIRTSDPKRARETITSMVQRHADTANGANPAAVFCEGAVPEAFAALGRQALWQLVPRSRAKKAVSRHASGSFFIGNGQGLVGAAGALGYDFGSDSTLELLCYRQRAMFGRPRIISEQSVKRMHEKTAPRTFNSYDKARRRVMISPRGPDPVFYGIRGEDLGHLVAASQMLDSGEEPAGYMVFQSNQGTGDHLSHEIPKDGRPYTSGTISGRILRPPSAGRGGHLFFSVQSRRGVTECAIYKESGITAVMSDLAAGDIVEIGGGLRPARPQRPRLLNAEFVRVMEAVPRARQVGPVCVRCQKRMKSKGRGQGFACPKCKSKAASKATEKVVRIIRKGLYLPAASAQRHLSRPMQRQGACNRPEFEPGMPWLAQNKTSSGE